MSAVAFVVAWSDDAGLQDYGENVNARKLGHGAGVPVLPMHAVFQTHMDLGGWVVRWASNASEKERDALLGMMPAVAFNKKCYKANAKDAPTAAADSADGDYGSGIARAKGGGSGGGGGGGGWELVPREPPMAVLSTDAIMHTTHPYSSAAETFEVCIRLPSHPPLATCPPCSLCLHCLGALQVHSIPGAESLELYFDRRSSTEEDHDVVRVYAGASFNRLVLEHSGGTTSRWPGTAGVPPVVVPGDTFGVSFRADISDTSWGWAITARARVPHALVTKLHTLLSSHGVEMSDNVLEAALAQHKLSVDDAKTLLLDENEGPRFQREHQQQFSVGYYQRKGHNMRVNLQAAEVYLSTNSGGTRMQMPTPPLIAHNPDFKAVFEGANKCAPLHTAVGHVAPLHSAVGHVSPSLPPLALLTPYPLVPRGRYMVEVGRTTKCQELELSHNNTVYRIAAWKPLSPGVAGGHAIVSYALRPLSSGAAAQHLPRTMPSSPHRPWCHVAGTLSGRSTRTSTRVRWPPLLPASSARRPTILISSLLSRLSSYALPRLKPSNHSRVTRRLPPLAASPLPPLMPCSRPLSSWTGGGAEIL